MAISSQLPITLNMIANLTTCVNKKQRLHLRPKRRSFDAEDYDNGGLLIISASLWYLLDRGNQILSCSLRCTRELEKGVPIAACSTVWRVWRHPSE